MLNEITLHFASKKEQLYFLVKAFSIHEFMHPRLDAPRKNNAYE